MVLCCRFFCGGVAFAEKLRELVRGFCWWEVWEFFFWCFWDGWESDFSSWFWLLWEGETGGGSSWLGLGGEVLLFFNPGVLLMKEGRRRRGVMGL